MWRTKEGNLNSAKLYIFNFKILQLKKNQTKPLLTYAKELLQKVITALRIAALLVNTIQVLYIMYKGGSFPIYLDMS